MAQLTSFHALTVMFEETFLFCWPSLLPHRGKMLTLLRFPQMNQPSRLGKKEKKLGSFICKDSTEGKWKCEHFPDMKSRAHQDSIMIFSRIAWTPFSWTLFFQGMGLTNGKSNGYDLYRDECQHKLVSFSFFPLCC